ncbi:MAG: FAD-binding oxidoreductase, partial [Verrucomicrobiota bacterium]
IRGGGTGNYGQLIPLYGGAMLDLSGMDQILSMEGGVLRAEPGVRLATVEAEAGKIGWELRCMPSTWVKSSFGGFLAGGSGGIGSITYGGIATGDNMASATICTVEAEPRIVRIEGPDCLRVMHTYGTNGILVEAEMRLGPKRTYEQLIFSHADWATLFDWTNEIAQDRSVAKRLVTQFDGEIVDAFRPLRKYFTAGEHVTFLLVEKSQADAVKARAEAAGIRLGHEMPLAFPPKPPYLTDYTWNHTTLWALKKDPTITYLQLGFGATGFKERVDLLKAQYPEEIFHHLEFTLNHEPTEEATGISCGGLPIVKFTTEERLNEIIDFCWDNGIFVANPHTCILEEGGRHEDIEEKRRLKELYDPAGLLNPGKMKTHRYNPFAATA